MTTVAAYAAPAAKAPLERTTIERREVGAHDVLIDIKFAGICHSDIHTRPARAGARRSSPWCPATRSRASSPRSAPP